MQYDRDEKENIAAGSRTEFEKMIPDGGNFTGGDTITA